jgi:hypothetical protein
MPDPEERGRRDRAARLVEHAQPDPPDEDRADRPEHDHRQADRPRLEPGGGDERGGEPLLLRPAVALAGEEGGERPVQEAARQQADDDLVRVEAALRPEPRPDPQADADEGERYGRATHRRIVSTPAAQSTKRNGRLA